MGKRLTAKEVKAKTIQKRDTLVLRALDKGLSYRQIDAKYGIPKSTAFDISVRNGVYSKFAKSN